MPYVENLGSGGGTLDAQYGSSSAPNTNAPLLLDPRTSGNFVYTPGSAGNYVSVPHADSLNILGTEGERFLSLPGVSGNVALTPDATPLDITGDIELIARVSFSNWAPSSSALILSKHTGNTGYYLQLLSGGAILLAWGTGSAVWTGNIANPGFVAGSTYWIRANLRVDNGAGNHAVTISWAVDQATEPVAWTSPAVTLSNSGSTTVIATNNVSLQLGAGSAGLSQRMYRAIVRADPFTTPTTVFDADFSTQTIGSRGFIESTGKLVTLTGTQAQIVDGTTYGFLPGVSGTGYSTPDAAVLDVSDFEITARIAYNDYVGFSQNQTIVAKYDNTGPQRSFIWFIGTNGRGTIDYDIGGVAQPLVDAGAAYPFTDGVTYWVRLRRIAATGVFRFDWAADSPTEPTVWTNVGGDRAGTAGVLNNSTSALTVGAFGNALSGYRAAGRVFRAIVRNANTGGTVVFDADFTRQIQFTPTFRESSSNAAVVTVNGAARVERARDLELVLRVSGDTWSAPTGQAGLADKNNSWSLLLFGSTNRLRFAWLRDGTGSTYQDVFSNLTGFVAGQAYWIKVTTNATTGTVSFYQHPDQLLEPSSGWSLISSHSVTGMSFFPSTGNVIVSGATGATEDFAGKFFRTIIRNGIDGPAVLDLDFTQAITTGSEAALEPTGPGSPTIPQAVQFAPNLGTGGAALNARYGSAVGADTNDPLLLEHTGTNYLYLPGVAGNSASTPDAAALDITGDIDIRVRVALDNWAPSGDMSMVAKLASGQHSYRLLVLNGGRLYLDYTPDGSTLRTAFSSIATGLTNGAISWVRVTRASASGEVLFYLSSDGTTWAQLGTPQSTISGNLFAGSAELAIGARPGTYSSEMSVGKFYRAQVLDGIGGTVVFDADFTTGITSGAQTTFTESSSNAATVTINRSTSGRKSVAVVEDVWLFGTDDYMEVADNDLLDFGASDSFTVVAVARQWGTIANGTILIAKASNNSNLATSARYLIRNGTSNTSYLILDDGVNVDSLEGTVTNTPGALSVIAESVTTSTIQPYLNGVAGTSSARAAGNLANSLTLSIGRPSGAPVAYADMELLAVAVFRRALSAEEIALVNTHYTSGPTAASNRLLSESVWWIDAGRTAAAQINRSTSGRKTVACADCIWLLGTDDFFEVADNPLLDFAQGEDFTLLSLVRVWNFQGTNDALIAKSSSTTTNAAGYSLLNGGTDPLTETFRLGDGSNGAAVTGPARVPSRLVAVWAWRDTVTGLLHVALNNAASTTTADLATGDSANSLALRLGALSGTASEFLDAEMKSTAIWRRTLTAAERAAVNNYYGTV